MTGTVAAPPPLEENYSDRVLTLDGDRTSGVKVQGSHLVP